MKLSRLKKESRLFWPDKVDISDGIMNKNGSIRFPNLASIQDKTEIEQSSLNIWHDLINWSIYVGYVNAAKIKYLAGEELVVYYKEIDWELVASHAISTLSSSDNMWPGYLKKRFRPKS